MNNSAQVLPLFMAIPLGAAFLSVLLGRLHERISDWLAIVTTAVLAVLSVYRLGLLPQVYHMGNWPPPFGINLVSDPLSTLLLLVINGVSLLVCI